MRLVLWFMALSALTIGLWLVFGGRLDGQFSFEGSVKWLEDAGLWAWAAGILLLMGDLLFPLPGTVVISALGYVYGIFLGGLISAVGLILAGVLGYGLGRLCGEKFARRCLGERDFDRGTRLFEKSGAWVVALSRALPILPEVISCTAGLVRMPFRRFVVALACGSVPMGFVFAAIGRAGHEQPGWALGLSLIAPALLWLLASRMKW